MQNLIKGSLSSHPFSRVEQASTGHTFRATESVECLEKIGFENVFDAIEYYGGRVVVKKE